MRLIDLAVSIILGGCVTNSSSQPAPTVIAADQTEQLSPPDPAEIERAHNEEDLEWIASRFAGNDGTINYRDAYDDFWTWQYVGYAFLRTGDHPRATMAFRRVLELKPNFSPAIYNLACVAARSGRSEEAFEILQLLATRVRPYASLTRKYHEMLRTDPDLSSLHQHVDYDRTLALFE